MKLATLALTLLLSVNLYANCQSKYFSFKVNSTKSAPGTILNVLENISDECGISIVFTDEEAKKRVEKKISYLKVKDSSIDEILELLL